MFVFCAVASLFRCPNYVVQVLAEKLIQKREKRPKTGRSWCKRKRSKLDPKHLRRGRGYDSKVKTLGRLIAGLEGNRREQLAKNVTGVDGAITRLAPAVVELWDLPPQKDDS